MGSREFSTMVSIWLSNLSLVMSIDRLEQNGGSVSWRENDDLEAAWNDLTSSMPLPLLTAIKQKLSDFNELVSTLNEQVDNLDFWKPANRP